MTEEEIKEAVKQKKPYSKTIDNPSMGNPNSVKGEPGYVITGIHCSKGVGGNYATDGISELIVHFTHISEIVSHK